MVATLRVVLDESVEPLDADVSEAGLEIARALIETAPSGCEVAAIVPADSGRGSLPGLSDSHPAPLPRVPLVASWQLGIAPGIGGGLIHAPSLVAPLVRHDRVHDHDQTVVTLWDLDAWHDAGSLPRSRVVAQRALLRRAEKHADAVVVPTHSIASALAEISPKLASRTRVTAGAAPSGFRVPNDAVGRRRHFGIPDGVIVMAGEDDAAVRAAVAASGLDVVVLGAGGPGAAGDGVPGAAGHGDPGAAGAEAAGDRPRVHRLGQLDAADRAAVLDAARIVVAPSTRVAFPWRLLEAMALGIPVVASSSGVHVDVLHDGALIVDPGEVGDAAVRLLADDPFRRLWAVRSGDRGRAFSWRDHAERVWALHAEL